MPQPSQLSIATAAVQRLLKEEKSYHEELAQQEARIQKLQNEDLGDNRDFQLKQERQAADETKKVFGPLRNRISDAASRLEEHIDVATMSGAKPEGLDEAQEALEQARAER